ncbi:MAG: preprotein translocase subunit SecE, partial [Planctomycetota bacterium]
FFQPTITNQAYSTGWNAHCIDGSKMTEGTAAVSAIASKSSSPTPQGAPQGGSFIGELFHAGLYKPNQGRIVRQVTALAIMVVVALASWSLYSFLRSYSESGSLVPYAIPGGLLVVGAWLSFRLVHWPRFADFLVAVEAELNKVTWPGKDELRRASFVVIFTIAFLAIALFLFDIMWQGIFSVIGIA